MVPHAKTRGTEQITANDSKNGYQTSTVLKHKLNIVLPE